MTRYLLALALLFFTISCTLSSDKKEPIKKVLEDRETRFYSKAVADTFSILVSLSHGYDSLKKEKYPVVYLLDANIYFGIMSITFHKYSEIGLVPKVILVGIGYKDFSTMDSLRNRDDTYPIAIPEYEMSVSGGAKKFLSFISNELIPRIDKEFNTDSTKRLLMGHSLGGYFTTYSLFQNLAGQNNTFNSFVAASPSIHYNKYYLLNLLKEMPVQKSRDKKIKAYIAFGGLEDAKDSDNSGTIKLGELSKQLANLIGKRQSGCVIYKSDIYSNLDHMDTQIPTFIKGLQWTFNEGK